MLSSPSDLELSGMVDCELKSDSSKPLGRAAETPLRGEKIIFIFVREVMLALIDLLFARERHKCPIQADRSREQTMDVLKQALKQMRSVCLRAF